MLHLKKKKTKNLTSSFDTCPRDDPILSSLPYGTLILSRLLPKLVLVGWARRRIRHLQKSGLVLLPIRCGERRQGYSLVLFGFDVVSWRGGIVRTSTACSVQTAPQRDCRMHSKMGMQKAFHPTTTVQENPVCVINDSWRFFLKSKQGWGCYHLCW